MIKYKGKTLTAEQENHINTIIKGNNFAIQAPPGSGKTFLLLALARKMKGYGLSVSFNKMLAIEASKKFTSSVQCKTGHALAYGAEGFKYRKRLKKITGKLLSDIEDIGDWQAFNSPANKGYLILNTIRKFCYSADKDITKYHVPQLTLLNNEYFEELQDDLVIQAQKVFNKMINVNSEIPINHDIYLKVWALTNPIIRKDYIFFDEYQDSNPVIADTIKRQSCQKIFVGDAFQQIYSWRGAVNALKDTSLDKLYITQSFRFGNAIAAMCNTIITSYYPYEFPYQAFYGNPDVESTVHYIGHAAPDCIICRTNKGVIQETIQMLADDYSVHILGGTQPLTYLINSIYQLKSRNFTNHPDLFLFKSFQELKEYAESDMGGDLKPVLKLLDTYGREKLLNILESTTDNSDEADVTITTAHKSKGLEWPTVRLANDFKFATEDAMPSSEETNILYVAASRALHNLDVSGCLACLPASLAQAKKNQYEQWQMEQAMN
jgi:superfamily I DNA/RNA helicase